LVIAPCLPEAQKIDRPIEHLQNPQNRDVDALIASRNRAAPIKFDVSGFFSNNVYKPAKGISSKKLSLADP